MTAKTDLYQTVTDRVIEAMESGKMPWQRGWDNAGAALNMPRRSTGEFYRGINVLLLWARAMDAGFGAEYWMTFKQAKELGGMVRKGEKGTQVVYFNMIEKDDKATGESKKIPFLRNFTVFNADQIDGLPAKFHATKAPATVDNGTRHNAALDSFFNATGANIQTRGNQPCYKPGPDLIEMPAIEQFKSESEYYGTLSHELIHWTGHATRLDRLSGKAKEDYAFEELIAELGALYLTSHIGATPDFSNSAAYLNSWLSALRNDKKYIFRAATAAQKATDLALEKGKWQMPDQIAA